MIPRLLGARALTQVLTHRQPLDEVLSECSGELDPQARAWLKEVCSGTLRWMGRLEQILDSYALKKKPSGWLRKILLMATYQLVVQDRADPQAPFRVHPGAVVSETVSEIKKKEGLAPSRFANALLRKVADSAEQWKTVRASSSMGEEEKASWASLPLWLWKRLVQEQGEEWVTGFAEACLARPELWIRVRSESFSPSWAQKDPRTSIPTAWKATEGGILTEKEGFRSGEFIVQDISSQRLVHEISRCVRSELGAGLTALDLCAAPGGKAIGLNWEQFDVTATDHGKARLSLLRSSVERVRESSAQPGIFVKDSQELKNEETFDLVWVDAPCSGTGIIRRHPDIRWIRQEKDLASLRQKQKALLEKGFSYVRSGGFLAYSVCSVLQEEGPLLVKSCQLRGQVVRQWFFGPQEAPFGDGFWAILVRKA